jgi:hypothetical protein
MKSRPDGPSSDDPVRQGGQRTGDEEYDTLRDYWDGLSHKGQWEAFFEAARQRDLAIAHDRQPYPTAEAYETLAAAHAKYKAMYRQAAEWITDVQMHYVLGPEATPEDVFMVANESQDAADTSGLREALEALPSIIFTPEQDSSAGDVVYRADVLAALRGATERPLDVERLTTAMANVGAYYRAEHPNGDYTMVPRTTGNFAALIAVEYARLASPTTTTPETEG